MKFCQKCGKKMTDEAKFCESCGTAVEKVITNKEEIEETSSGKKQIVYITNEKNTLPIVKNLKKIVSSRWFIICAAVLAIGIIAVVLFIPRDLKMDDFKKTNIVSSIIRYGIPESIDTDEDGTVCLDYGDKLDFYGITPYMCFVYPEENRVFFLFTDEDEYDVYKIVDHYCKLEDKGMGYFHTFSYENLEISTHAYDGSSVSIDIY